MHSVLFEESQKHDFPEKNPLWQTLDLTVCTVIR